MKTAILFNSTMRYAILADIHANLTAFSAVLDDIKARGGVEEIWCLGDLVGYGPDPHECIRLLREHNHVCVAGNHDLAVIGKVNVAYFNPDAAVACQWTAKQVTSGDVRYLESLLPVVGGGDFTLVHGSPREPVWEYLLSASNAAENFNYFKTKFCLVGHSHLPLVFRYEKDGGCSLNTFLPDVGIVLGEERLIINPGAVGQPRDGDPRASYVLFDVESGMVKLHRVPYDIKDTQGRMAKHNLPGRLIARLRQGV